MTKLDLLLIAVIAGLVTAEAVRRVRKRRRENVQIRAFEEYFAHLDKNRWDL